MPTKSGCGGLSCPNGLCCFRLPFGGEYSEHSRDSISAARDVDLESESSGLGAPHLAQKRKPISRNDLLVRISILRIFSSLSFSFCQFLTCLENFDSQTVT